VGLDAVVYRNRQHLQLGQDTEAAKLIPETGEIYFEDNQVGKKHSDYLKAYEARLGNIAEIAELRDEIIRLAVPTPILCEKILYSGFHSGDSVPVDQLTLLLAEVRSIRNTGKASTELWSFLDRIEELIRTATSETNPIVFV